MSLSESMAALGNCELFARLQKADIEKIAGLGKVEMYEAGENMLNQGDLCDKLYVIAEGHVFLERSIDLGARKGTAIIALLGKGRALGCWSTLIGETHAVMSSAICKKPTKVIAIKGDALRKMMLENHELGFRVLERLCSILRDRIQGVFGAMENI